MRPEVLNTLFRPLEALTGVGPRIAKFIENLAGDRVVNLLWHLPSGLIDRRYAPKVAEARPGVVATITSEADDYAREVTATLRAAGLRIETDIRNEKINYKVREHSHAKVPAILVVGAREGEARTVAIRRLGSQAQEILALDDAVRKLCEEATMPGSGA